MLQGWDWQDTVIKPPYLNSLIFTSAWLIGIQLKTQRPTVELDELFEVEKAFKVSFERLNSVSDLKP